MINLHMVLPPASETGLIPEEPTWHDVAIKDERYNAELLRGLNWHNYCAGEKDIMKYMEQWIREYRPVSAKKDIAMWRDTSNISSSICIMARMQLQGFPLKNLDAQKIRDYVMEFTGTSSKVKSSAPKVIHTGPTIQDRIRAQVSSILSDLDVAVDDAFDGNLPSSDDIAGKILTQNFKSPQLKLVQQYLRKNIAEWYMAYNNEDEQLVEGYAYVGKRNFKKIIDVFSEVMSRISQEETKVKSIRIRKKKPVDKKKMASKIRFKQEHEGIKSCNPVDIIGANTVWVYDTKKNRLGYYEAEVKDSLFVKGAKIYGFKNTGEKILRKPDEQLKEMAKLRKNQTVNWFDGIKAKSKMLKGRMTADILILRID